MKRHRFALSFCALVLGACGAAIVVACSSDSSSSSGGTTSSTTTVRVTAAAGGVVADPSGKTTLNIPPGALEKDTDITLTIQPASAGAVVDVSEFGPDGLKFLKPVALSIKGDAALAPQGKSLALATLDGAAFKAIDGSSYAGGAASGSIMHFSKYSIVVVDGQVILQPPASCVAALSAFTPCGGDPKGTWTFADFCLPAQDLGSMGKTCPELTAELDVTIARDVVIDATTIVIGAGTSKIASTINYPLVCFGRLADGGTVDSGVNDCATVQTTFFKDPAKPGTCTDKGAGICACSQVETKPAVAESQTYTTSGNNLTTTKTDGTMETSEYCAKANLLTVKAAGKDGGQGTLYTLIRK